MDTEQYKTCNKCNVSKPLTEYELRADTGKYRNTCKECRKKYVNEWHKQNIEHVKQYNEDNKEHIKERTKKYYQEHQDHLKEYSKQFRANNKEYYTKYNKQYKQEHKDEISDYNKQYNVLNNDAIKQYKKEYHKANRDKENEYAKAHNKTRRANDPYYKLKVQLRHLIYHSLERKGYSKDTSTFKIIGTDYNTFYNHLLETYKNNYGCEWDGKTKVHIDHITPLATATTEQEIIKLCNYKNLQLLKEQDNLLKGDKLDYQIKDTNN